MGQTPDRKPGPLQEDEEIQFEANPTPPTQLGAINFSGSSFFAYDSLGIFNLRQGGSDSAQIYLNLLDDPLDGSYIYSFTKSGNKIIQEKWLRSTDSSLKKVVDYTYTGNRVNTEIRQVLDSDGISVLGTATFVYSYTGSYLSSYTCAGYFSIFPEIQLSFLLLDDPLDGSYTYTRIKTGNKVTQEKWIRVSDSTTKKTIDYTYTGNNPATRVQKVYAADGTTVLAQETYTYTYSYNAFISSTVVRDF